ASAITAAVELDLPFATPPDLDATMDIQIPALARQPDPTGGYSRVLHLGGNRSPSPSARATVACTSPQVDITTSCPDCCAGCSRSRSATSTSGRTPSGDGCRPVIAA